MRVGVVAAFRGGPPDGLVGRGLFLPFLGDMCMRNWVVEFN